MTAPDVNADVRARFEAEFSKPPFEFQMDRWGADSAWQGQYRVYHVQCAWEGYRAAHLTQPAQAVDGWQPTDDDVQAWRGRHNISLSLYDCRSAIEDARIMHHFDVRPAALPNANGKEG